MSPQYETSPSPSPRQPFPQLSQSSALASHTAMSRTIVHNKRAVVQGVPEVRV